MAERNFANRTLYHGDNLDFLRGMNSETVDLIATDPPFNKNRDFHATPDSLSDGSKFQDRWSWRDDIHEDWLIEIQRDHPEAWSVIMTSKQVWGDDMAAFLCWLGVRALEMHRVLKPTGSFYLHIDHTAHAYVKTLLDAIFGHKNFRNDVVWKRTAGKGLNPTRYLRNTDFLLYYWKGERGVWNQPYTPYSEDYTANWRKDDKFGAWMPADLSGGRGGSETAYMPFNGKLPPSGRAWAPPRREKFPSGARIPVDYEAMTPLDKCHALDEAGLIHWSKNGKPYYKKYASTLRGVYASNLIDDIPPAKGLEHVGYPTQKPLALYERIIKASSNPGDMVLDPFCGCATTPVAAERLKRDWVGMDIWDGAHQQVLNRLQDELLAVPNADNPDQARLLTLGEVTYSDKPPVRTDAGEPAAPPLQTPTRGKRHPPPRTRHRDLLLDLGAYCQGCGSDYSFDPRALEVDHMMPKVDGGTDAYSNLTLLCGPCNKEKRDRMTLTGLQMFNRREGHLKRENEGNIRKGRASKPRRSRKR